MRLEVRCFAGLRPQNLPDKFLELPHQSLTAGQLLEYLALAPKDVKIIFVNGLQKDASAQLQTGDRIAFVPAVGGG